MRRIIGALSAVVLLFVAACTYGGGGNTNPVVRKFTWFSYVNGDDIRAGCAAGGAPSYRFVYNGVYVRQFRTYDIVPEASADGRFLLTTRVVGPTNVARIVLSQPSDVFSPGRGTIRRTILSWDDVAALDAALTESDFYGKEPVGTDLRDLDFFWTGVACVDGVVTFNAYKWPSQRFAAAKFPDVLFSLDPTGIAVAQPREVSRMEIYGGESEEDRQHANTFLMTVGDNGLVGVP